MFAHARDVLGDLFVPAIDLAQQDVPVVVLDDNDKVSFGSRAICFAKRPLEILDQLDHWAHTQAAISADKSRDCIEAGQAAM